MSSLRLNVSELVGLAKQALADFEAFQEGISVARKPVIKLTITDLETGEGKDRSQGSYSIGEEPEWIIPIHKFISEQVKVNPAFKAFVKSVASIHRESVEKLAHGSAVESQCSFWLETFISRTLLQKAQGRFTEDWLLDSAALFRAELELAPSEYHVTSWLQGLYLESTPVTIGDNIRIRKPAPSDLGYTRPYYVGGTYGSDFTSHPNSILEFELLVKDQSEVHSFLYRLMEALRIYSVCGVHSSSTTLNKVTALWPGDTTWNGTPFSRWSCLRNVTIRHQETEQLAKFISSVEPKLNFNRDAKEGRSLGIAITRYNHALVEPVDHEQRLMYAVMGLEGLLMLEKDRGENMFKLGIRVAKLMSHLGEDPLVVRSQTEEAYWFRNKLAHGDYLTLEKRRAAADLLPRLLEYLRLSILVMLNKSGGKESVVDLIDKSLVSTKADTDLRRVIESTSTEFSGAFRVKIPTQDSTPKT